MAQEDISKELEAAKIEGEENDDDYFEKVLETEMALPTDDDDDAGADTSDKKVADKSEEDDQKKSEEQQDEEDVAALKAKIAQLEKEAKGRLSDVVKSRQEKSQMKTELAELKSAVSTLLEKRNDALKEIVEEKEEDLVIDKRGVQFDDDDKAFVDLSDVDKKIESETQKTRAEIEELKAEKANREAKEAFETQVKTILNEDETAFTPAFDELRVAYKNLNDAVIAVQHRLEIEGDEDGTIDQDTALDLLHGSEELKMFQEIHPGIDPIKVARAFNSKVDFRTSLRDIANVRSLDKKDDDASAKLDEKLEAAKKKPGSLSGTENQAGGNASLLERIASLGSEEILSMGDAEAAKIEAMLENEELKGE
jgi:hypothetical protein